jgi:hypothetical protein
MKNYLLPAALVACAITVGCTTSAALNKIRVGMTKDEVVATIGQPSSTGATGNIEYLTYYLVADDGYGRDQPYMVRLVDGKVESFGRSFQLWDAYYRPTAGNTAPPMPGQTIVTQPTAAAAPHSSSDIAAQLDHLKQLHDQGVLNDDEFARAKARVLSESK